MTSHLVALNVDALDPHRQTDFWAGVLGWPSAGGSPDRCELTPPDDTGFLIRFAPTEQPKAGQNQLHFDLTSTSLADQQHIVAKSVALGARHVDVGQRPDEGHVVLADPEGNEFCVVEPGNAFLAGCGFIGALSCTGSRAVGHFWREALGWPLVWDEGEETAIRAPHGGPKISWDGVQPTATTEMNRFRFDLTPPPDGDQDAEARRLVALGATRLDRGPDRRELLTDPDGNEFALLAPPLQPF